MIKRLLYLNGISIIAVILNHSGQLGWNAMFWWTYRYRPVTVPNYDEFWSITYFILAIIIKLAVFSVPAFIFISGYFIGYSGRGNLSRVSWKTIKSRILFLVVPYLIWSFVIFFSDAIILGIYYSPNEYLLKLFFGKALGLYWFIPLLCQLYLISPFIVYFVKKNWKLLFTITALMQASMALLYYYDLFSTVHNFRIDILNSLLNTPDAILFKLVFFFTCGIIYSFHENTIKEQLYLRRRFLLLTLVIFGALAIIESAIGVEITGGNWFANSYPIFSILYSFNVIACFLAYYKVSLPFSLIMNKIGSRTFGLYLLHFLFMVYTGKLFYHFAPWALAHQALYQPIIIAAGVFGPLGFMTFVEKSKFRPIYRYLFG